MILNIYSVRDNSAQFHFTPFFARTHVEASRMFNQLLDDPKRSGARIEYSLYYHGTFDDQLGSIVPDNALHLETGRDKENS
jgi:hypothetical protein